MLQTKYYSLLLILFFEIIHSQTHKSKIVDSETGEPIRYARTITPSTVLYSNDDGFVLLPDDIKDYEVSASGYQTQKFLTYNDIIRLKPLYKDIDEVKIINVDIKKLFSDVLKNYEKRYYDQSSIYDILYKQKNSDDNILSFLLIADGKLWTESNIYNYKDAFNSRFDDFIQMEIDSVKYFKSTIATDDICKGQSLNQSKDFIGNIFFNYELARVNYYFKTKDAKFSGRIVNDTSDEQTIVFKISNAEIDVTGTILYHKIDKTIVHYELQYDQSKYPSYKVKTKAGLEYEFKVGNGITYYDFYKKGNKYVPSISGTKGFSYCTYNQEKHTNSFSREIIFQSFNEAESKGLQNKIDLTKRIWEAIPQKTQKDNGILLTDEEQRFINETSYEK